ncbi:PP2C family protein-serine/threonine phosphatase [Tessaracoccus lacteus]|uniref:Protein phosphatase 2C domain-containing protein n=1 Tax=Tessaracoccus lacteus TaxID=3041766 RepID=A0ABY8PYJ8_9ACTN|nr:protein phosphatase 2C domain-containing protein [Tessaracoccus sp. T21]WGT47525.1 protein phosphatase 2C domain-containing protein [Tessaracoccus sp. T21]
MFSLRFVAHSEVGRVRKNNQDAGYASPNMLLVTDGMGGAAAGDLASAVASTEAARSDVRAADGEEMLERIAGMMARTNAKLSDLIDDDLELDGMGTTFCGALFNGTQFGIGHIGDSRGYLLRDGELTQLTHDHSWVQSLIDEGKITPAQAAVHPHRSLILKVLNGQAAFEPDLDLLDAQLGDRVMFCSDGLSGLVDDATMAELLATDDLEAAAAGLAHTANANGGHDNITVVIGEVVPQDDELDAAAPLLVGSATEVSIPRTGAAADKGPKYPTPSAPEPETTADHDAAEVARYAPQEQRRRWPGIALSILAILLVLGLGGWGLVSYGQSRYYVAADDAGYVALYNGVPGNVLGVSLNRLVSSTDIPVSNLPRFYQRAVDATITVPDETAGESTTTELRALAERCMEVRAERANATPDPEPTVPGLPTSSLLATASPTTSPLPDPAPTPGLLRPTTLGTPTADAEEADPEAC